MADQKTEPESKPEATPESKPAETGERKVPESALTKQAEDFRAENAATRLENEKMRKQLAAVDSEKLKSKEAKMVEEGKSKELIDDLRKQLADKDAVAVMNERALLSTKAERILRGLGMEDQDRLELYSIHKLPQDATRESIDEWAKLIKADNAAAFTAPVTPVGQASLPGGPATDAGGGDLKARLQSEDKKVKRAALNEQLQNKLNGIG